MGKKHRRENINPGRLLGRRSVMFWALLMGVISSCLSAPAPIDHMTGKCLSISISQK